MSQTNKPTPTIYADRMEFRTTTAGGGRLLALFSNAQGERIAIGLDAALVRDLLVALARACATENAPDGMRAAAQVLAVRSLKPALIGGATPVLHQELELGVSMTTTVDSGELESLRADCERVLQALEAQGATHHPAKH